MDNDDFQEELEPVFPIYLDVEMLTGFLATLEGGFAFSSDVSSTEGSSKSVEKSIDASAGMNSLLNQLFRIDFRGNLEGSDSLDDRNEIRFALQHTEVSLFNRLRVQLSNRGMIQSIDNETTELPQLGSIVEFEGIIKGNPLAQVLNTLEPVMTMVAPAPFEDAPPTKPRSKQGKPRIPAKSAKATASDTGRDPTPQEVIKLLVDEQAKAPLLDILISLDSPACDAMILTLRRTPNIEESNAHFLGSRCVVLGKVTGAIEPHESVQLYRRSVLAVLGNQITQQFFSQLRVLNIDLDDLSVSGPALQILPVAIYV